MAGQPYSGRTLGNNTNPSWERTLQRISRRFFNKQAGPHCTKLGYGRSNIAKCFGHKDMNAQKLLVWWIHEEDGKIMESTGKKSTANHGMNCLHWSFSGRREFSTKQAYAYLLQQEDINQADRKWMTFGEWNGGQKWQPSCGNTSGGGSWHGRSFHGPSQCICCINANETIDHLFLRCPRATFIWEWATIKFRRTGGIFLQNDKLSKGWPEDAFQNCLKIVFGKWCQVWSFGTFRRNGSFKGKQEK